MVEARRGTSSKIKYANKRFFGVTLPSTFKKETFLVRYLDCILASHLGILINQRQPIRLISRTIIEFKVSNRMQLSCSVIFACASSLPKLNARDSLPRT
ncbi:hypothetical protein TNCV_906521 [Trichonephila clavipes]|nr:hypothetical protein TNCV_906521 [Trichonephila clavipes]